jgi:hypothetical protein
MFGNIVINKKCVDFLVRFSLNLDDLEINKNSLLGLNRTVSPANVCLNSINE